MFLYVTLYIAAKEYTVKTRMKTVFVCFTSMTQTADSLESTEVINFLYCMKQIQILLYYEVKYHTDQMKALFQKRHGIFMEYFFMQGYV